MRTLPLALVLVLLLSGCLGARDAAPDPTEDDPSAAEPPSETPQFHPPVNVSKETPGAEPMVAVAPDGTLYLTGTGAGLVEPAPLTAPEQGVWRSTDDGATWETVTPDVPTAGHTGVDNSLAVAADGSVYYANAAGSTLQVFASRDQGETWEVLPTPPVPSPMHRTWIVTEGEATVHLVVEGLPSARNWYHRSTDGGATWEAPVPIDPKGLGFGSDLAVGPDGTPYLARLVFGETTGDQAGWHLWRPDGASWSSTFMFPMRGQLTGSWQSLEVGPEGTLYMVWAEAWGATSLVTMAHSSDGGQTWSDPQPVLRVAQSQTLPWVEALAPGELGIVAYVSDEPGLPGELDVPWHVDYLHVTGADTAAPNATSTRVSPSPVHHGAICTEGPQCRGDRQLLDFTWIDAGPDGLVHLAYASTEWDRPSAFPVYAGQR